MPLSAAQVSLLRGLTGLPRGKAWLESRSGIGSWLDAQITIYLARDGISRLAAF